MVVIDRSTWGSSGIPRQMHTVVAGVRTYILQLPERLTPRGIQTLPNSSMKYRPCGLMLLVQWWAYELEEPGR